MPKTRPELRAARDPPPPKIRSYSVDGRHLLPMLRDFVRLVTIDLASKRARRHTVQLGRSIRQHAFDARDPLPTLDHAALAAWLGCVTPLNIVLPSIDVISLSGLGFALPYTILATVASALQPKKIFEIGTFRGVGALTLGLNCPQAEIYTLDLPPDSAPGQSATLSRGDAEWVRLSRGSIGFAFADHPASARIHQLFGNSLLFDPPADVYGTDLCVIDGGHSYECIRADTETALKILAPGGVILWDDYTWFIDGVQQYLAELSKTLPLFRIAGGNHVIYKHSVTG